MAAARIVPRVLRCTDCQYHTLRTFASVSDVQFPGRVVKCHIGSRRYLTTGPSDLSTTILQTVPPTPKALTEDVQDNADLPPEHDSAAETPKNAAIDSIVPWYLQVHATQKIFSPLSDRQKLPDLPENPPEALQAMLERLSIDIGLDDLTLLDLRELDPPPALGSNLIMLLGTARSEKHLHVSADRFCRWLRSEYKLSPYADGLLGRNELKLKLRRKARRAKLLGSVKASEGLNADDGIRTGWVCVNVGLIEKGQIINEEALQEAGIVGFSDREDGVNLVVQMLTEEKRTELDLEGLWMGYLRRQARKEAREAEQEAQEVELLQVGFGMLATWPAATDALDHSFRSAPTTTLNQSRGFHTCGRRLKVDGSTGHETRSTDPGALVSEVKGTAGSSTPSDAAVKLNRFADVTDPIKYLRSLSVQEAIRALGQGPDDFDSTPFLKSCYGLIPPFPESNHWTLRFHLACTGLQLGHSGYNVSRLIRLLQEWQASAVTIPSQVFQIVLDMLLPVLDEDEGVAVPSPAVSNKQLAIILYVMEDMSIRFSAPLDPTFYDRLALAVLPPRQTDSSTPPPESFWQVIRLMDRRKISFGNDAYHVSVFRALASANDWTQYWKYWQGIARRLQPKSALLYATMFNHVADSNHQRKAIEALATWIPELELEEPPIKLSGNVAEGVMRCVLLVDPTVRRQVEEGTNLNGWYVRLWKRCLAGIQQNP